MKVISIVALGLLALATSADGSSTYVRTPASWMGETPIEDALATCGQGAVAVAYSLIAESPSWPGTGH